MGYSTCARVFLALEIALCLINGAKSQRLYLTINVPGYVFGITTTPDGAQIVSGGSYITVWNTIDGAFIRQFSLSDPYRGYVANAIAMTPDGSKVISACYLNVYVWDFRSGETISSFEGYDNYLTSLALSRNGMTVVTGNLMPDIFSETIKVWNLSDGQLLHDIAGSQGDVLSVAITPDSSRIVSGGSDSTIKIWDIFFGNRIMTITGHSSGVCSLAVTLDGLRIVSGSYDFTIKIWDLRNGILLNTLFGHRGSVNSVAVSNDSSKILSGSRDKEAKLWNMANGALLSTLYGHDDAVYSVAFANDDSKVFSGGYEILNAWTLRVNEEKQNVAQ